MNEKNTQITPRGLAGARRALGLTQADVAQATGLSVATVRNYEAEPGRIRLGALIALAGAMGVEPAALLESLKGGRADADYKTLHTK